MRFIGWLLFFLVGLGWLGSEVRLADTHPPTVCETPWRRTCDGWELPSRWPPLAAADRPALHPVVVGLLEVLLSAAALVALPALTERSSHAGPCH